MLPPYCSRSFLLSRSVSTLPLGSSFFFLYFVVLFFPLFRLSCFSPFFRFVSPVSIRPFSPHCIAAFFYCGDLFKVLLPHPRSSSFFSLTDPFTFSLLYPHPFVHHRRLINCFFLSSPFRSARCLLLCIPHGAAYHTNVVSFNVTLRFCYVKLYISR